MNIVVDPDIQQRIEAQMKRGGFASPEDVVRYALALLDDQERAGDIPGGDLETLFPGYREKIARGIAEADAGMLTDGEEFFKELERRHDATGAKDGRKTA